MAVEPKGNEGRPEAFETLLEALGHMPDPRAARGVRYPLQSLLGL